MSYVPPPDQVDRGARALGKARGLVWERMNKDWQTEHRRQVIAILIAAHGEAPAAAAASGGLALERPE
jgi:glycine cleavage system protein P-like pyridoxal-binding family